MSHEAEGRCRAGRWWRAEIMTAILRGARRVAPPMVSAVAGFTAVASVQSAGVGAGGGHVAVVTWLAVVAAGSVVVAIVAVRMAAIVIVQLRVLRYRGARRRVLRAARPARPA
jgi:hypothetical protein